MPFMVVDQHLVKHPKTRHLARIIHEHARYAAGFLGEVWGWAIDAKPDGMIAEVHEETLGEVFGQRGKNLVRDLTEAYFICDERCQARGLDPQEHRPGRFHDWKQWAGKLVEGRERERLRGEHRRRGHPRPVDGCPKCEERPADAPLFPPSNGAQNPPSSGGRPATSGGRPLDDRMASAGRTEPSRTKPSREEPNVPPSPRRAALRAGTEGRVPTQDEQRAENEAQALEIVVGAASPTWQRALETLKATMPLGSFVSWFRGTQLEERDGTYVVVAPNAYARDWLREKYAHVVRASIGVVVGDVDVQVTVESEDVQPREEASA